MGKKNEHRRVGSVCVLEMREDMSFFHRGLYDDEIQGFFKHAKEYNDAVKNGDWLKAAKLRFKYRDELNKAEEAYYSDFLTPEEKAIIEDAYKVPGKPAIEGSKRLNGKVAENTRFRAQVSRRHGNVTGKELDAEIDKMSDEEVLDVLSSGNSYGQDYRKYIEDHPKKRQQMIANIKKAMKVVGVFSGATAIPDTLIEAEE